MQACDQFNGFVYTYDTRYETRRQHVRAFACRSHELRGHRIKIRSVELFDDQVEYVVEEGGQHSEIPVEARRRGIHPSLTREVDMLLRLGWSAGRLRGLLLHRFHGGPQTALVPTARQIENRRSYLVRTAVDGWEITAPNVFIEWANRKRCSSRDTFLEVTDPSDPRMDDLIVLDTFLHGRGNDEGASFGVIVTSRRVFRNVAIDVLDQGSELLCATDGTYKLHFGGWTVVDCGSEVVTWARGKYVHRFIPWAYMFVRSETTAAYAKMFEVIRICALEFLAAEVDVAYRSLDHSEAIATAFEQVWPDICLLNCWPHLARQARKKRLLLNDTDMYDAMIKPQLQLLQTARTHAQCIKMSEIVTENWIDNGESEYAEWLRSVYLTERWSRWHMSSAGVGGVIPSQQGIESHHDLEVLMARVAPRRAPGRPRARRRALEVEPGDDEFFNVDRLIRLFIQRSGYPLGWRVMVEQETQRRDTTETSEFFGVVAGVRMSNGVLVWSVRIEGGELADFEAEYLARAARRAHLMGVSVTN